jgi:type I restriction enzyme, S subunit
MTSFKLVKIGEIGEVVTGRTPKTDTQDNFGQDYMFLGPTDLQESFKIKTSEKMLSAKGLESIKSSTIDGISICVGCIGSDMGNVSLVMEKCATNQQINSITRIKEDIYNPFYIYYWLKGKKQFLFNLANVTTTPILNKTNFSNIEINLPTKSSQDKVANFLMLIDEKIELNNKINKQLEMIVKLIYDYWFVQFDFPDENGKPYKSSGGKMVYNKDLKREIPMGWGAGRLSDFEQKIITGKTPSTDDKNNFGGDIPFICIGDVRGNMYITKTETTLTGVGAASQANKFIPKDTICVTCIASPGLVAFTTSESQTNQQLNSVVCGKKENRFFLYFYLKDYFNFAKVKMGNTFANMNKDDFSSILLPYPKDEIVDSFSEKVKSVFESIMLNSQENNSLIELRDFLLPMLMNGQVTVSEAS